MGPLSALHGSFTGSSASNKTWTELSPLLCTDLISLYSSAALELPRLPNCANKALKPISRGQSKWRRRRWLDRSKDLMDALHLSCHIPPSYVFSSFDPTFPCSGQSISMHFGNMMSWHFLAFEPSIQLPQQGPHVSSAIGITSALHVYVSVELHLVQCKPADGLH